MTSITAERRTRAYPKAIPGYVAVLGIAAIAVATIGGSRTATAGWPQALGFLALLTAAARLGIDFRHRDEILTVQLFEAILAPALIVLPTPKVALLVALAHALAEASRRVPVVKGAFNVAQWTLTASVASITFNALGGTHAGAGAQLAPLLVAMTIGALVNSAAFMTVLRMAQPRRFRDIFQKNSPAILLGWAVNLSFGMLFVAAQEWHAASVVLFAIPLIVLHVGFRGHADVLADRRRLAGMHAATEALTTPMNPRDGLRAFLEEVRRCFEADGVELLFLDPPALHRADADGYTTPDPMGSPVALAAAARGGDGVIHSADTSHPLSGLLRAEGYRDCLTAPLINGPRLLGVLCIYNRAGVQGSRENERAVLDALARGAAGAIERATLLESMLEERRKLADIVEYASDAILTADMSGTILTWNPALGSISGFDAAEMVGSRSLAALRPRTEEGADVRLERWADEFADLPENLLITTRNGEQRALGCSYTVVPDANGEPSLLIFVGRDKTLVREAERLREDFVAAVSHELRTPLTPIKGFAATLIERGESLDAASRETAVRSIARQADRLERLITNLLEMTKVERGVADRPAGPVNAAAAAAKVVTDIRALNRDREIRLSVPIAPVVARGEALWIEQIVANLLSNALKYSPPEAPIFVSVDVAGDEIHISVTDRGAGISDADSERVFERFRRLTDDVTRATGGAGIGLYISRHLARMMDGELSLSPSEEGAAFTLTLRNARLLAAVV